MSTVLPLRWDHSDLSSYYQFTGLHLQPILEQLDDIILQCEVGTIVNLSSSVNAVHDNIINVLNTAATKYVPRRPKNYYKYWWDEEMDNLKQASIESNQVWKAAGKPRDGSIFDRRQSCRLRYRKEIRARNAASLSSYSNDLHEALLRKNGNDFWKSWNSKFECKNKCEEVEGCSDFTVVADKFVRHFSQLYTCNNASRADELYNNFCYLKKNYHGLPFTSTNPFNAELVGSVIAGLKRGKAAGIDNLSAEHVIHSHPILPCILAKLFNLILQCCEVPCGFRISYTVPIPKIKDCRTKSMSCDDFRGIAISSILSKIFEHGILDHFSYFLRLQSVWF
jgi:hypothetical protein